MFKVNFYIDGFNFYYGLLSKGWKKYYWLNIVKFCESFLRPIQSLEEVFYCTAVTKSIGKKDRQDLFFSANKVNPRFKLVFGKFIEKQVTFGGKTFKTFEEKQTDVNIAVEMIRNVVQNKCDTTVLISADSDLVPPINLIRELDPNHKIFTYFPPKRYSTYLRNISDASINLNHFESRFKKSLLPDEIVLPNGYVVKKPSDWN